MILPIAPVAKNASKRKKRIFFKKPHRIKLCFVYFLTRMRTKIIHSNETKNKTRHNLSLGKNKGMIKKEYFCEYEKTISTRRI